MNVYHAVSDLAPGARRVCVAIGVFDGVHLGHQVIIRRMVDAARDLQGLAVVLTFDRHPNAVVAPDRTPFLLYSMAQKLATIDLLKPDATVVIPFDKPFSLQTGEQFIRGLASHWSLAAVCVGEGFTFGARRSGNVELLKSLGVQLGFQTFALPPEEWGGEIISSTRIRQHVRTGEFAAAGRLLGRPYALAGTVVLGDRIGRQLGFPTANLDVSGLLVPPSGVYAARARCRDRSWPAVLNIGVRPTLNHPEPALRVEAHLLGFSGDLYGESLEVAFARKLRDEMKFDGLPELKARIARDVIDAAEVLEADCETSS